MKKSEFTAPTLADADSEYGALDTKYASLARELSLVSREADDLAEDIRNRKAPGIRPGIAELLGDVVDHTLTDRPRRLVELRQRVADLEAATDIVRRRRDDRHGTASLAACRLARDAYGQRVAAFIAALRAAKVAYDHAEEIVDALEREDVQVGYLSPARTPFFAGSENGLTRFVTEARSNSHVS